MSWRIVTIAEVFPRTSLSALESSRAFYPLDSALHSPCRRRLRTRHNSQFIQIHNYR